jgi:hypothetical protein
MYSLQSGLCPPRTLCSAVLAVAVALCLALVIPGSVAPVSATGAAPRIEVTRVRERFAVYEPPPSVDNGVQTTVFVIAGTLLERQPPAEPTRGLGVDVFLSRFDLERGAAQFSGSGHFRDVQLSIASGLQRGSLRLSGTIFNDLEFFRPPHHLEVAVDWEATGPPEVARGQVREAAVGDTLVSVRFQGRTRAAVATGRVSVDGAPFFAGRGDREPNGSLSQVRIGEVQSSRHQ